jgi:5-methylcytosine-specific restriction endonuclease McrA
VPNGQWRGSTRRQRLPANWPELCRLAREIHGTSCYLCGSDGASDTDHVAPGDDHSPANLRPICRRCHTVKSSREGGQAAQAARPKRTRAPEAHPGMR